MKRLVIIPTAIIALSVMFTLPVKAGELSSVPTTKLCQVLGGVAVYIEDKEERKMMINSLVDEIDQRSDWNKEVCADHFNLGAGTAAMDILETSLGD